MDTQQQKKFKILLIGDVCVDEYQYGTVERISPEAPVPVFKLSHTESKPGMAGNVRKNLETLGLEVTLVSGEKSTKTRLIDLKSKQQIVRIDNDVIVDEGIPITAFAPELFNVDAIVISDYNKGLVSYTLVEHLAKIFKGPIFVDTKKPDLARFNGCYVKINETDFKNRTSINDRLIVTMGDRGAMFKIGSYEQTYIAPKIEISDATGAGDTFLAALVYQYLMTKDVEDSIKFAIRAATVTVQHMGVYAPKLAEIE